ncbi:hypothetical protein [Streptomyces sp. CAU 1734]|uniref:hypothetical protein n=1 Tax=Streptomyces sp. CAU 1734 TaxID=3140360 RepID=UPI0032610F3A
MAVDPVDPDVSAETGAHPRHKRSPHGPERPAPAAPPSGDGGAGGQEHAAVDREVPEADAAEQRAEVVVPERDDPLTDIDPGTANEADAVEQSRVVVTDEDDYR